eukprot:TRINITY_DN5379_c0_g2_i1.p1 TRINITY_DN5379_c0_g2~~TRINITY_DN5379_c0_g2_i1.p1  ORF type:complete len:692 (+),score=205.01 TRINITY_DN5379_c0_g2_i1:3-2078(+)
MMASLQKAAAQASRLFQRRLHYQQDAFDDAERSIQAENRVLRDMLHDGTDSPDERHRLPARARVATGSVRAALNELYTELDSMHECIEYVKVEYGKAPEPPPRRVTPAERLLATFGAPPLDEPLAVPPAASVDAPASASSPRHVTFDSTKAEPSPPTAERRGSLADSDGDPRWSGKVTLQPLSDARPTLSDDASTLMRSSGRSLARLPSLHSLAGSSSTAPRPAIEQLSELAGDLRTKQAKLIAKLQQLKAGSDEKRRADPDVDLSHLRTTTASFHEAYIEIMALLNAIRDTVQMQDEDAKSTRASELVSKSKALSTRLDQLIGSEPDQATSRTADASALVPALPPSERLTETASALRAQQAQLMATLMQLKADVDRQKQEQPDADLSQFRQKTLAFQEAHTEITSLLNLIREAVALTDEDIKASRASEVANRHMELAPRLDSLIVPSDSLAPTTRAAVPGHVKRPSPSPAALPQPATVNLAELASSLRDYQTQLMSKLVQLKAEADRQWKQQPYADLSPLKDITLSFQEAYADISSILGSIRDVGQLDDEDIKLTRATGIGSEHRTLAARLDKLIASADKAISSMSQVGSIERETESAPLDPSVLASETEARSVLQEAFKDSAFAKQNGFFDLKRNVNKLSRAEAYALIDELNRRNPTVVRDIRSHFVRDNSDGRIDRDRLKTAFGFFSE